MTELYPFEFETVTVDREGAIVERSVETAQQMIEPLGNGVTLELARRLHRRTRRWLRLGRPPCRPARFARRLLA